MKSHVGATRWLCVVLTMLLRAADVQCFSVSVGGTGFTSLDNAVTQTPISITETTLPSGARTLTGTGDQRTLSSIPLSSGLINRASVIGSVFAAQGLLRAKVEGVAEIGAGAPNVPTLTHGTPRARATFSAAFEDTMTIRSDTLAAGTPVEYVATVRLSVAANLTGHIGGAFFGYNAGTFGYFFDLGFGRTAFNSFPNSLTSLIPSFSIEVPLVVSGVVGAATSIRASLSVGADDRAGAYFNEFDQLTTWGGFQTTQIDASHTAQLFLDPVTPGITLVAESGHDYSISAVPLPASWVMLLAGAGTLGTRRLVRTGARARRPSRSIRPLTSTRAEVL